MGERDRQTTDRERGGGVEIFLSRTEEASASDICLCLDMFGKITFLTPP